MYKKDEQVPTQDATQFDHSWLGQWSQVGWAIRIEPRLTMMQWAQFNARSGETWDATIQRYDPVKALAVLAELFPTHELRVVWPKCGKRIAGPDLGNGKKYFMVCGAAAKNTEMHLKDVYDNKVALARCDAHEGQL